MTMPAPVMPAELTTFAQAEDVLAAKLPGYRRRPQQGLLAQGIELVLQTAGQDEGFGHLLAEAGTGTGKSLAAAIPAILSGQRIMLVTTTISLMNQYVTKDLPFLEEHLGKPFTWAPLKGLRNFLCLAKLEQRPEVPGIDEILKEIETPEGAQPHSGDRDDITVKLTPSQWSEVSSSSDECPGKSKCPLAEACFGLRHKAEAVAADVVVTNAAMMMTDVKLNKQIREGMDVPRDVHPVVGEYDGAIFDEAHELIDIATDHLGTELKQGGLYVFSEQATTFVNIHSGSEAKADQLDERIVQQLEAVGEILCEHIGKDDKATVDSAFIEEHFPVFKELYEALEKMVGLIEKVKIERGEKKGQREKQQLLEKTGKNHLEELLAILSAEDHEAARWAEKYTFRTRTGGEGTRWTIKIAPIDVGPILRAELWNKIPAVLMSATLTTGTGKERFGYMAKALGLEDAATLDVGSPFDYNSQALLYYPHGKIPSPARETKEEWATWAPQAALDLVRAAGGGAMLLYTSRSAMNATYGAINDRLRNDGINTFIQGADLTNKEIAQRFRDDENSVLFGLRSFMTGMDFPGRTNRLVIIDKLPFPVPSEPIFQARERAISRRGGHPFSELSVPMMTLILEQAFGRLIRTLDDWGVVAILDSRLHVKPYGQKIVRVLPPCPATMSIADVKTFFSGWNQATAAS